MPLKVSSLKRAVLTQEEYKIQLGLKIKNNNNIIDIYNQIYTLTANQKANYLKARNI